MTDLDPDGLSDLPGWDRVVSAGSTPPPSAEVLARTRAAVRTAVAAEHTRALAPVRRRPFRRLALVGLVAAALTGIAVVGPTVNLPGSTPTASANAATFLRDVAARVTTTDLSAAAPLWRMDYVSEGVSVPDGMMRKAQIVQWLGPKGTYLQLENGLTSYEQQPPSFGPFTWKQVRTLPADTSTLATVLDARAAAIDSDSVETRYDAVNVLLTAPVSAAVRRSLFELASQAEGVTLEGAVTDTQSRNGTALTTVSEYPGVTTSRVVLADDGTILEETLLNGADVVERRTWLSLAPSAVPAVTAKPQPTLDRKTKDELSRQQSAEK